METITLSNGVTMPAIGYGATIIPRGTGKIRGNDLATTQWYMYKRLLSEHPGLLYDISPSYGLCEYVFSNARAAVTPKPEAFLMIKISNHEQRSGDVLKAFEHHLEMLGVEAVDLLMLHWPHPGVYLESWKALEEVYASGRAKALGVSNFHEHHLDSLLEVARVAPVVNQIEVHPLFTQVALREYCARHSITVMAYSPLGRMHDVLIKNKTLRLLVAKYKKTVPQIIIRWDIDSGMATILWSLSWGHYEELLAVEDFSLEPDDLKAIEAVNENVRLRFNPDTVDYTLV